MHVHRSLELHPEQSRSHAPFASEPGTGWDSEDDQKLDDCFRYLQSPGAPSTPGSNSPGDAQPDTSGHDSQPDASDHDSQPETDAQPRHAQHTSTSETVSEQTSSSTSDSEAVSRVAATSELSDEVIIALLMREELLDLARVIVHECMLSQMETRLRSHQLHLKQVRS